MKWSPGPVTRGGIAGVATTLVFMQIHAWWITDIWFSVLPMTAAGLACGTSLAWTYKLHYPERTWKNWVGFIALHTVLLLGLGAASVIVLNPILSYQEAVASEAPPPALFIKALPVTVFFVFLCAAAVSLPRKRSLRHFGVALLSSILLFVLLGLNVSILGLVDLPAEAAPLVAKFFTLLLLIMVEYAVFYLIANRLLRGKRNEPEPTPSVG